MISHTQSLWICPLCKEDNPEELEECCYCHRPKPGGVKGIAYNWYEWHETSPISGPAPKKKKKAAKRG